MARNEIKMNLIRSVASEGIKKRYLFVNEAFAQAEADFIEEKEEMLQEFDNHPVTQEIKAGPYTSDENGTLGTDGNLFAFIGFEAGTDPTIELRQALDDNTVIKKTARSAKYGKEEISYSFPVFVASLEGELAAASPVPFNTSKSWALMIEGRGFSDINFFLNRFMYDTERTFPASRSGPAIQVPNELRQAEFTKRDYLSEIINKFNKKFKKF